MLKISDTKISKGAAFKLAIQPDLRGVRNHLEGQICPCMKLELSLRRRDVDVSLRAR